MTNYGDLLSANSLLLAVLGVVFSVWYPEIMAAINIQIPAHKVDVRPSEREIVSAAMWQKAIPLAVVVGVIFLVFVPNTVEVVKAAVVTFVHSGFGAFRRYDAVKTAFVVVTVLEGLFELVIIRLACSLRGVHRRQGPAS
jgi:hypothetical protein